MAKPHLALVTPTTEVCTVVSGASLEKQSSAAEFQTGNRGGSIGNRSKRRPNAEFRTREHLTTPEVEALIEVAKQNRYGRRDALMILLAFRHGLRAAEVVDLRWEQVDFKTASLHVRRVKNGTPSTHPLTGREMRELRRHQRESPPSPFIFVSERGAPLSAPGFSRMVERLGVAADLDIKVHAHMLRHSTGFKLANHGHDTRAIQDYLGHRNIQNTAKYTALAPGRFKNFWQD
jgi:integrase